MCNSSYVIMLSDRVRELCLKSIEHLKSTRLSALDEEINYIVARSQLSWWRRLMSRPVVTREEALKILNADPDPLSELSFENRLYARSLELPNRLLVACDAVDEIYVSVDDLEMIS